MFSKVLRFDHTPVEMMLKVLHYMNHYNILSDNYQRILSFHSALQGNCGPQTAPAMFSIRNRIGFDAIFTRRLSLPLGFCLSSHFRLLIMIYSIEHIIYIFVLEWSNERT